jgi:Pyruvate/2-oxoacid:ferredoxin oxidoreductase delta subunit
MNQGPADYENWIQCPTCLWICPLHEIAHEEEIKDTMETIDNPFEQGKFILETVCKRNSPKGKKLSAKKRKNKIKLDDDPEIDALLRAYGNNVKVQQ